MKPTEILIAEHRVIEQVLNVLEQSPETLVGKVLRRLLRDEEMKKKQPQQDAFRS